MDLLSDCSSAKRSKLTSPGGTEQRNGDHVESIETTTGMFSAFHVENIPTDGKLY